MYCSEIEVFWLLSFYSFIKLGKRHVLKILNCSPGWPGALNIRVLNDREIFVKSFVKMAVSEMSAYYSLCKFNENVKMNANNYSEEKGQ